MKSKRKICVLTGTRSEYGLLRSLMRAIEANPRLELQVVVTGMHLLKEFGRSVDLIRADGFKISSAISMYKTAADVRSELPASVARLVDKLGKCVLEHQSDFIVVLGDRVEALGGALAGLTANVPIAHLHGGELAAGDMDDRIRFAISALASLHFVSTTDAQKRLLRAGEPPDRIFVVGAMAMDEIFQARRSFDPGQRKEFRRKINLPADKPMLVVVHHSCGFGTDREYRYMENIFRAVKGYDGIVIGPNNDPGHSGIRRAIRETFSTRKKMSAGGSWSYFDNLSREDFLMALWSADCLVGNSSSGILEANALYTAVVNIGPRQAGRQRNGNAIFDCNYGLQEIKSAIREALNFSKTHKIHSLSQFGTGQAGEKITQVLSQVSLNRKLIVKTHF
ncbi:MAG: UDP-N-acetylglucosamine 2-epimerase [Phycisphaerae bacterium]